MKVSRYLGTIRDNFGAIWLGSLIGLAFLFGGSSRPDTASLILFYPLVGIAFACGAFQLNAPGTQSYPWVGGLLIAAVAVTAIQLVPLPPTIWQALPGRDLQLDVARIVGQDGAWQPISMIPFRTATALFALLVPAAVLIWARRSTPQALSALLPLLLVIGGLSALLGLMQALDSSRSALYFYRISSRGYGVGLFANRNHQAVFLCCLFPMLAVYASTAARSVERSRFRLRLAIAAGVLLVPLILVTGSRAALLLMVFVIPASALLYRKPKAALPPRRRGGQRNIAPLLWIGGLLGLAIALFVSSRATAVQRLLSGTEAGDGRLSLWRPIAELVGKYLPVGSGAGTFVEIYQIDEPMSALGTEYLNHAHNDWLETALTHGVGGVAILLAAVILWAWAARILLFQAPPGSSGVRYGRLGLLVSGILGIASIVDYPVRTPALAALLVLAGIWIEAGVAAVRRSREHQAPVSERGGASSGSAIAERTP